MRTILIILLIIIVLLTIYLVINKKEGFDNSSLNLPDDYLESLKNQLNTRFGLASTDSYNFTTVDDKYKCTFKNSPERTGVPFNRTIIHKKENDILNISSTNCPENAPEGVCNTDKSNDINLKLFYENNEFVNYKKDRNKVFLHLDELRDNKCHKYTGFMKQWCLKKVKNKTYADFQNVTNEQVPLTYFTKYNVCKPVSKNYFGNYSLEQLFPCGAIACVQNTEMGSDEEPNYKQTEDIVNDKFISLMKKEHQSKIDEILESIGFKTWLTSIDKIEKENKKLNEFCDNKNDDDCIKTTIESDLFKDFDS